MTKPIELPISVVGRLLATVSWEHATWYHAGGQGRENVLTAEVFQALDLLPRTSFLGNLLLMAHGAESTIKVLADEVEELNFTLLPDSIYISEGSPRGRKRLWVQPDGLMESKSVFCLVEAKRIKTGSFQAEQLAREYLAALRQAKARNKRPLLLLVLPKGPEVRVSARGARTRLMTIRDAIAEPLGDLLQRAEPEFATAEELLAQIESVIAYATWDEIKAAVSGALRGFRSGDASIDSSVSRVAETLLAAIKWHGLDPYAIATVGEPLAIGVAPICMYCIRYHRKDGGMGFRCDAFPDGIPESIITNEDDHRGSIEGDHGLRWEQDPALPRIDNEFYHRLFLGHALQIDN